jgi:hypothetical protein
MRPLQPMNRINITLVNKIRGKQNRIDALIAPLSVQNIPASQ